MHLTSTSAVHTLYPDNINNMSGLLEDLGKQISCLFVIPISDLYLLPVETVLLGFLNFPLALIRPHTLAVLGLLQR